jgi:hypothetical protein
MCVLCGYGLSPYDWAEATTPAAASEARHAPGQRGLRRSRIVRARICDAVLETVGVRVRTPTGREYVLHDRKGHTRIARTLGEVWGAGAALGDRPLDPLDPALLARLTR